jgi:hypothetical protein
LDQRALNPLDLAGNIFPLVLGYLRFAVSRRNTARPAARVDKPFDESNAYWRVPLQAYCQHFTPTAGGARCVSTAQTCNAVLIIAYKMQRLGEAGSCSIDTIRARLEQHRTQGEHNMKRLTLTLIAGALLAASLSGCIVAPAPGYYGGGYHHYYYN